MQHKKSFVYVLLACCFLLASLVSGCGGTSADKSAGDKPADAKKTVTVTTSFLEDMTKQLAGDYVNIELIIPAGEDPHLYVAQPADLEKIKKADLLLYHGLHFEGKMAEVLEKKGAAVTKNFTDSEINYMEEDGKRIVAPHFWFDVALYKKATEEAAAQLEKLLPDHKADIEANLKKYLGQLDALDNEIKEKIATIPEGQRNLVTPHDAFNYFSHRYHMNVVAPQGVSTDSEVANADVEKTANFIVEHKVKAVFAESTTNPERMKKLQEVCKTKGFDVEIVGGEGNELFSDSLAPAGQKGDTYIDMYKSNVDLIVSHLK